MAHGNYKTKAMQLVEHRIGVSLEKYIADRYAAGLTQAQIADELHVTSGTVSKWMYHLGVEAHYGPKKAA